MYECISVSVHAWLQLSFCHVNQKVTDALFHYCNCHCYLKITQSLAKIEFTYFMIDMVFWYVDYSQNVSKENVGVHIISITVLFC